MAEETKKPAAPAATQTQASSEIDLLKQIQEQKKQLAEMSQYKDNYENVLAEKQKLVKTFAEGDFIRPEDLSGAQKEEKFKKAHNHFFNEEGDDLTKIQAALDIRSYIKEKTGEDVFTTRGQHARGDAKITEAKAEEIAAGMQELLDNSHGSLDLLMANKSMQIKGVRR